MKGKISLLGCLVMLAFGSTALAGNPILDALRGLNTSGFKSGGVVSSSPTKYKPTRNRKGVEAAVTELASTDEERKAFRESALAVVEGLEKGFVATPFEGDASANIALGLLGLYTTAKNVELADDAFIATIGGIQRLLDSTSVRDMSDADKELAGEKVVALYAISGSLLAAVKDDEQKAQFRQVAGLLFTLVTGASVDSVNYSAKSFEVKAVKLPVQKTPAEAAPIKTATGIASNFGSGLPTGWTQKDVWMVKTVADGTRLTSGLARLLPAVTPGVSVGQILSDLWAKYVPQELAGKNGGIIYRRYVGSGVPAYFIVGAGREKGREADSIFTLMLVDCESHWQPIVMAQTYEETGDFRVGVEMSARFSLNTTVAYLEEYLATIKCDATKGKPLFDKSSLVGEFGYGSYASMDYVNVYSGASSTSYTSYGGTLNLKADGTFTFTYGGASSSYGSAAQFGGQKGSGTWTIQEDILTLNYTKFEQFRNGMVDSYKLKEKKYRVGSSTSFSDGVKIIILKDRLDLPMSWTNLADRSDWYTTKKPKE
ncbi:MAG: hypothetical protein WCK51_09780 [Armatimonadota bacterium]